MKKMLEHIIQINAKIYISRTYTNSAYRDGADFDMTPPQYILKEIFLDPYWVQKQRKISKINIKKHCFAVSGP